MRLVVISHEKNSLYLIINPKKTFAMKKIVLICLTAFFLLISAQVNAIGFGLKGGLNFSSIPSSAEFELPGASLEALPDSYTGFHIGVVGHFSLLTLFLQPEILYTQTGQEMVISSDLLIGQEQEFFTHKYSHLTIPVIAGMKFGTLQIGVGPVASFMLDNKLGGGELTEGLDFDYKKASIGFQAMAGIKLGNLLLDFKYEGNLSKMGDGISVGTDTDLAFDTRPRQFIISVGFLLF